MIKNLLLPGGAYIANTYDSVARLTKTALLDSGLRTLDSYNYGYNQASQRTNVVRTLGDSVNYTYDNMGELISATASESGGVTNRLQEQFGYAYDAAGNLNQRTNNALVQSFNVNNLNELTTLGWNGTLTVAGTTTSPATNVMVNTLAANLYRDATFAKAGFSVAQGMNTFTAVAKDSYGRMDTNTVTVNLPATVNYSYDLNGNLLGDGNRSFAYDDENQLTSVWVTNVWRSDFVYDGKMRCRIRREYNWQSGIWNLQSEIRYVYDGNLVIQERDANNLPLVTYTRGNDLSGTLQGAGGIGGVLARTDLRLWTQDSGLGNAFYHADRNGNITALINGSQAIVAKYLYDPYGNTLSMSGPLASANTYRFSSKEWNANSGLYYYLYRFYDPNLQRWPNRDPLADIGNIGYLEGSFSGKLISKIYAHKRIGFSFEALEGANLFDFVRSNPINEFDADGTECGRCQSAACSLAAGMACAWCAGIEPPQLMVIVCGACYQMVYDMCCTQNGGPSWPQPPSPWPPPGGPPYVPPYPIP